jgi:hypothetical protein
MWAVKQQALVIEHAFDSDLAKAKDGEARQNLIAQRDFEASEYWNALAALRSRKLADYAEKLYIPVDDLKWERDQYANYYLHFRISFLTLTISELGLLTPWVFIRESASHCQA